MLGNFQRLILLTFFCIRKEMLKKVKKITYLELFYLSIIIYYT